MKTEKVKQYGPVTWSDSLLSRVYSAPSDNDDSAVTEADVGRWTNNAIGFGPEFRAGHEDLVERLK